MSIAISERGIQPQGESPGPRLDDLLSLARREVRPLSGFIASVTVLATAATYLMPQWYRSKAEFTIEAAPVAGPSGSVLGLASQLGLAGFAGAALSVIYYQEVLTSNLVLDRVALGEIPTDSLGATARMYSGGRRPLTPLDRDRARRRLLRHFASSTNGRASTIAFSIEARTPYAARAAADTILAALNETIIATRRRRASAERAFLESRLDSATQRERALEDSLRTFYVANRIINTPNLLFTEARLKRKVDFALELTSQLRAQVEQAKLQEVHDTPVLSIISPPDIPGKRSSPNRRLVAVAALIGSSLLYLMWAGGRLALSPTRRPAVPLRTGTS